jgi:peptide deformylase
MPKSLVLQYGEEVLHDRTRPVTEFDEELQALCVVMRSVMHLEHGVGLAAPQIGHSRSIFVWEWDNHFGIAINPTLSYLSPYFFIPSEEGCLSLTGQIHEKKRYRDVRMTAQDENGYFFEAYASGFLACIFQHEVDHLMGRLICDR